MKRRSQYLTQKLILISIFLIVLFSSFQPALINQKESNSTEPNEKYKVQIDSILSIMTLEEKIGQLNQLSFGIGWGPTIKSQVPDEYKNLIRQGKIGSFLNALGADFTKDLQKVAIEESRLKIPLLFGYDVIHGFRTTFPVPLAEASSWDPELVEKSSRFAAQEAASVGVHWTFAPMVDIARDPRWGRIVEGSGEDTYLGSVMAAARVKGFQGDLNSNKNILACAKHFAAYGAAEGGRDYNTVDISERTLREIYLPPFKAAVDAGAETFMCSFNEIAGIPSSANEKLLTGILRNEWGFNGFVVSDWNSIGELVNHRDAKNLKAAAELGITAGVDMDMEARSYIDNLTNLVREGNIPEKLIDTSVRRILKSKFKLGLFENPYKYCNAQIEKNTVLSEEIQNAAFDDAKKSIILLKNENAILPLEKNIKTIAIIGPLANSKKDPLGTWHAMGDSNDVITVVQGIKNKVSNATKVLYSKGCSINDSSTTGFKDAIKTANKADVVIMVIGESETMSGEAHSRSSIELPGIQNDLVKEIYKTRKPVVAVLMNGRPLATEWISDNIHAIIESWFLGIKSGSAIAEVLFGDYNPSGKLPVTVPRTTGQIPIYYNQKSTGRPGDTTNRYTSKYIDLPLTPLYPFGYGLSYTQFDYSNLTLSSNKITSDQTLKIKVDIKNSGNYDGEEVVQLYIRDDFASVTRPVKELKRFKKIFLKKGETKTVGFEIDNNDFSFYNKNMKFVSEPGMFTVYVGTNSVDVIQNQFELISN